MDKKKAKNDIHGALQLLYMAIQKNEDLYEAYKERSLIRRMYAKDYEGARADLTSAAQIKPDDYQLYVNRSELRSKFKKELTGALSDIDMAEKAGLRAALSSGHRAIIKRDQKDYRGAISEYEKALKVEPDLVSNAIELTWLIMGLDGLTAGSVRLDNFLSDYNQRHADKLPKVTGEKVIKNSPPVKYTNQSGEKESVNVIRHTKMDLAANSIDDLIKKQGLVAEARSLAEAFALLGSIYIKINEHQKALDSLGTALVIHRNQDNAYGLRSLVYIDRKEFDAAIKDLDQAIKIVDLPFYYFNRGIAYLLKGDEKRARKDFDKYIELDPEGKANLEKQIAEAKQKNAKN